MSNLKFQMSNNAIIRYWKFGIGSIENFKHSSLGFSLIELMVAFSLMALIAGIGFASFSNYNQKQTVTQASQDVKLVFDNAKFNAISSVKSTSCANSNLVGYKVVVCSKATCLVPTANYEIDTMCSYPDPDSLLYSKKLPQNVTVKSSSTCTIVKYNTLSNFVEGGPCVLTITGYGIDQSINIDVGGNASTQ